MKVTGIRIHKQDPPQGKVLAFADIRLDDVLVISRIRVVEGRNGIFAAMPSWRNPDGTWADFVIPQDEELRQHIQDSVLDKYRETE